MPITTRGSSNQRRTYQAPRSSPMAVRLPDNFLQSSPFASRSWSQGAAERSKREPILARYGGKGSCAKKTKTTEKRAGESSDRSAPNAHRRTVEWDGRKPAKMRYSGRTGG